jgi:DNA uptake protein ComE-like DNA-binding protein
MWRERHNSQLRFPATINALILSGSWSAAEFRLRGCLLRSPKPREMDRARPTVKDKRHPRSMRISTLIGRTAIGMAALAACVGCNKDQSPQEIREKTAQATAELKQNAKAVAEGVKEGWSRDKPLDLNKATREQVEDLPGVSRAQADQIVAGRPYGNPHQLVTKRILTEAEYGKISDRVVAKN